jgi:uncharacterized membrane protein YjjP (DUF1212 family)
MAAAMNVWQRWYNLASWLIAALCILHLFGVIGATFQCALIGILLLAFPYEGRF